MEVRRIFITGSSGFIGRSLIDQLLKIEDLEVVCFGNNSVAPSLNSRVIYKKIDLLSNPDEFFKALNFYKPKYFIHLAWDTRHGIYWSSTLNDKWNNFSKAAIDAFIKQGGIRAILAGTSAEVDLNTHIVNEDSPPPQRISVYGQSKLDLLKSLEALNSSSNFTWVWPRFFNIYGPNEDPKRIVPRLFMSAHTGEPLTLSSIDSYADFIYVEDVAIALCKIIFSQLMGAVNVAYGESISIRDIIRIIEKITSNKVNIHELKDINEEKKYSIGYKVNISKIMLNVEWMPRYSMEDGLLEYSRHSKLREFFKGKK